MSLQPHSVLGTDFGGISVVRSLGAASATTLRERADVGAVLLSAACDADAVTAPIERAVGLAVPARSGPAALGDGRVALWLSPRSWLILCSPDDDQSLADAVNDAFADKCVHACPYTDALCWFELSGPSSTDVLTETSYVSLERGGLNVGSCKRTRVASIAVILFRSEESQWFIGVERSRARYFADWLIGGEHDLS